MYTIEEPYTNSPEAKEGTVPFFVVKNLSGDIVFSAVTMKECETWIEQN